MFGSVRCLDLNIFKIVCSGHTREAAWPGGETEVGDGDERPPPDETWRLAA